MVLRQKVWVDTDVQGVLIGRVVLYWVCALLFVGLGGTCFQYYQHPDWTMARHAEVLFTQFWPWLPSAVLCLPLIVFDIVRLSNLFVGPIYRLRLHLAELNVDPSCRALKFRDDDYWQDLVEPVHCLQAELLDLRSEVVKLRRLSATKPAADETDAVGASVAEQVAKLAAINLSQRELQQVKKILPAMGMSVNPST